MLHAYLCAIINKRSKLLRWRSETWMMPNYHHAKKLVSVRIYNGSSINTWIWCWFQFSVQFSRFKSIFAKLTETRISDYIWIYRHFFLKLKYDVLKKNNQLENQKWLNCRVCLPKLQKQYTKSVCIFRTLIYKTRKQFSKLIRFWNIYKPSVGVGGLKLINWNVRMQKALATINMCDFPEILMLFPC